METANKANRDEAGKAVNTPPIVEPEKSDITDPETENDTQQDQTTKDDRFNSCFEFVLGVEGGFVNDKYDSGGKTKFGISASSYPDLDIENLTVDDAKEIYKRDYWNPCQCDDLVRGLDICMFDTAVNMGVSRAKQFMSKLLITGDVDKTVDDFLRIRLDYYDAIVESHPEKERFIHGWRNRIESLRQFIIQTKE